MEEVLDLVGAYADLVGLPQRPELLALRQEQLGQVGGAIRVRGAWPSRVLPFGVYITPALLIGRSIRGWVVRRAEAAARTDASEDWIDGSFTASV